MGALWQRGSLPHPTLTPWPLSHHPARPPWERGDLAPDLWLDGKGGGAPLPARVGGVAGEGTGVRAGRGEDRVIYDMLTDLPRFAGSPHARRSQ